ncbi:hypothetical protein ES703_88788 [subsurface metagenome]
MPGGMEYFQKPITHCYGIYVHEPEVDPVSPHIMPVCSTHQHLIIRRHDLCRCIPVCRNEGTLLKVFVRTDMIDVFMCIDDDVNILCMDPDLFKVF